MSLGRRLLNPFPWATTLPRREQCLHEKGKALGLRRQLFELKLKLNPDTINLRRRSGDRLQTATFRQLGAAQLQPIDPPCLVPLLPDLSL